MTATRAVVAVVAAARVAAACVAAAAAVAHENRDNPHFFTTCIGPLLMSLNSVRIFFGKMFPNISAATLALGQQPRSSTARLPRLIAVRLPRSTTVRLPWSITVRLH